MWWASIPKGIKTKASFLLLSLGVLFGTTSLLIFTLDPVDILTRKILEIKPYNFAFGIWKDPPYEVMGKVYIFNVTNGQAFLDGEEKLKFIEVGPYVYKEAIYRTNISVNNDGTLSFISRRTIQFMHELSVGDPLKDTLWLPNLPLLGIISTMSDNVLPVRMAVGYLSLLLSGNEFLNLTVDDYLFGYDDHLITLASQFMPNWIHFSRFGVADRLMSLDNASNIASMTLEPGLGQYSVKDFNGSPRLEQWGDGSNSTCGLIRGAYVDPVFPRNLPKDATLTLYRHGFCRPIPIHYNHTDTDKYGYKTYTYALSDHFLAPLSENPNNHCYCKKARCDLKGIGDISPCYYGVPIAISQPHFLNADPKLLEDVGGLSPDPRKHNFYTVIHPESGLALEVKFRIQLNLNVPDTDFNYKTRPFNNLVVPLVWLELSVDGPPALIKITIDLLFVVLPWVQQILRAMFAFLGATLPMVAAWIYLTKLKCLELDSTREKIVLLK
ncbi:hypothetical protein PPYR_03560 [Photinus pyralis]|uniref:Scavenger receptor class B member 1 n=1 Tax=Photinus pyralis TaxID=7054 RepID=A0A5N4A356_PHOPY|nr:scavenger receptor class B member 1-like [Photinus pyralis]KAB0791760.1 hypothetical protein PPYR_03560 [Photinus pyralis]